MNWGEVYAHLITVTGWTWEYIDENMTLPRLAGLSAYWESHPPTHIIAAAYAGIEPKEKGGNANADGVPDFALLPDIEE